jgi:RNA polymerase sigma-70 factor (ECF subfamily)
VQVNFNAPNTDSFEAVATTHLDAAYNLARWLTHDTVLAQDVVQDAMLRALTYFQSFRGENPRAWLLQIVRNVALNKLDSRRRSAVSLDSAANEASRDRFGESFGETLVDTLADPSDGPEEVMQRQQDRQRIGRMLMALPVELRECLVLRELEECSYKEIARIIDAPVGTVMSRLWRARKLLIQSASQLEELK